MISNQTRQLVQHVFMQINNHDVHEEVKEDPEAYLISLLTEIKNELSGDAKYRATLYQTVHSASYQRHLKKAKEQLKQPVSNK